MADFPALIPSLRTLSPGAVAQSQFRAYGGQESRARLGAGVHGHTISLSFSALTFAEAKSIRDHYLGQQGSFVPFDLPADVWSGFSAYASILPEGYQWIYAGPPQFSDVACTIQSATVQLVAVFNFAETGFVPAAYDDDLTPTTDLWDPATVEMCSIVPEIDPSPEIDPYDYTYARWNGVVTIESGAEAGEYVTVTSWSSMASGQYLTLASQPVPSFASPSGPYPGDEAPWVKSFTIVQISGGSTGSTIGLTVTKHNADGGLVDFLSPQRTIAQIGTGAIVGSAVGVWEFTNDTGAGVQASFDGLNDATPEEAPPALDPSFANVSLLLHMDGANGSTTFTDSSVNGFSVTAFGNAKIATSDFKFGDSSGLFDGTGDHLQIVLDNSMRLDGDFTFEAFIRPDAAASMPITSSRLGSDSLHTIYIDSSSGAAGVYAAPYGFVFNSVAAGITSGAWFHLALTRSSGNTRLFVDGVQVGSTVTGWSGTFAVSALGALFQNGTLSPEDEFNGYMDEVRITKGVARYTADFTPPTAPFPDA